MSPLRRTSLCLLLTFAAAILIVASLNAPCVRPGHSRTLSIRGTLVVMVPSSGGLVIAADSRSSPVRGIDCDDQVKIFEPRHANRMILTVTGTPTILQPSSQSVPLGQLCEYIHNTGRILDISRVALDFLDESTAERIEALDMNALLSRCINATRSALTQGGIKLRLPRAQDMFSVVVAAYDPDTRGAAVRGFVVALTQRLEPVLARTFERRANPEDNQLYWAFGETDYLNREVIRGVGRRYLSAATKSFYAKRRPVRDVTIDEAQALAVNLIAATSRTTAVVRAPGGIGGPIDVVLIGQEPRPVRLQWKSP